MDDRLARQLNEIIRKADKQEFRRALEFWRRMESLEEPTPEEKAFIIRQMNFHKEAMVLGMGKEKGAKLLPFILFAIGRAYERYYVRKREQGAGENGRQAR